jgi:cyclopropane-fatty-acyl-phospholipid synthase
VESLFSKIELGTLVIRDETIGTTTSYGQKMARENRKTNRVSGVNGHGDCRKTLEASRVELVIKKEAFWVRLFLFADMAFAEAYMLGEVECADLTAFFQVFCPC